MRAPQKRKSFPDALTEPLNELSASALRAVRTYVEQRLDEVRPTLPELIRSEADGEIVDIIDRGAYTVVRKYPPSQDSYDGSSQPLSLYRAKRVRQMNGEETVRWSYLGDVTGSASFECRNCGFTLTEYATVCPRCGEEVSHGEEV